MNGKMPGEGWFLDFLQFGPPYTWAIDGEHFVWLPRSKYPKGKGQIWYPIGITQFRGIGVGVAATIPRLELEYIVNSITKYTDGIGIDGI